MVPPSAAVRPWNSLRWATGTQGVCHARRLLQNPVRFRFLPIENQFRCASFCVRASPPPVFSPGVALTMFFLGSLCVGDRRACGPALDVQRVGRLFWTARSSTSCACAAWAYAGAAAAAAAVRRAARAWRLRPTCGVAPRVSGSCRSVLRAYARPTTRPPAHPPATDERQL